MKKILTSIGLCLILIAFVSGCKNSTTNPVTPTSKITGEWKGTTTYLVVTTINLDLNLTEAAGVVAGSGNASVGIASALQQVPLPVLTGTFTDPNLSLTATGMGITYSGALSADGKTIVGTVSGSLSGVSVSNLAMTLTKQ